MDSVNEVATALEQMKNWATESEKKAIDYVLSTLLKGSPEYEYIEVRSFAPDSNASDIRLNNYLNTGYEFVRASEFIPSQGNKAGYIEYILRRKKK